MKRSNYRFNTTRDSSRANSGQALLMTVLLLGGVMIGATAISGIVLIYSVRQVTQAKYSTQAIYAADAGLEWELYQYYADPSHLPPSINIPGSDVGIETCSFVPNDFPGAENGSVRQGICPDNSDYTIRSVGKAGGAREVRRAFELLFEEAP